MAINRKSLQKKTFGCETFLVFHSLEVELYQPMSIAEKGRRRDTILASLWLRV